MERVVTLTKETKITLGTFAAVLVVGIGATWTLASILLSQFNAIHVQVHDITSALGDVKTNAFTLAAASEHSLRTAIENPGLRVPDPRDPSKVFVVDVGKRTGEPAKP
jgi:hypothetical protein